MSSPVNRLLRIASNFLQKVFLQRYLIFNFVIRDLRNRYVGSLMGFFWAVVHPLVLLISYTFIFSVIFRIRPHTAATDNFAIFVFCGILPWLYFQETVIRCCNSVVENSNLIRKTVFPSEILPLSVTLSNVVTHLVGLLILLVVLVSAGLLGWTAVFVPLSLFLLFLFSLGLGWLCAALQVFLRDTLQVISVMMVMWFWFTPVFYSVEMVPLALQPLIRANPLTYVVRGYRLSLLEHRLPDIKEMFILALLSLLALVVGGYVFRRTKREFADVI